jgi:hypothetical protein
MNSISQQDKTFFKQDSTSLETCQYFFPNKTVPFPELVSTFFKTDSAFLNETVHFRFQNKKYGDCLIRQSPYFAGGDSFASSC